MKSKDKSPSKSRSRKVPREEQTATDLLRQGGGDRRSMTERDMVQGSLKVTTQDLQASIDGVDTAVLNFDVKTYIEEAVDQRCLPILATVKKYDVELSEWKNAYKNFRIDYEEDKETTRTRIMECVKEIEYANKWREFEKKYDYDTQQINQGLDKCTNRLNRQDAYNERNDTNIIYHEGKIEDHDAVLRETNQYVRDTMHALKDQLEKNVFMLTRRCDQLDEVTLKLDTLTQTHQTLLESHSKTINQFSRGFEVFKDQTKINFKKQLHDYNRKVTSLRHQAESSTIRMGL